MVGLSLTSVRRIGVALPLTFVKNNLCFLSVDFTTGIVLMESLVLGEFALCHSLMSA